MDDRQVEEIEKGLDVGSHERRRAFGVALGERLEDAVVILNPALGQDVMLGALLRAIDGCPDPAYLIEQVVDDAQKATVSSTLDQKIWTYDRPR